MMNKLLVIPILFTSILSSCRFSKPLTSQIVDSEIINNNTNDTITIINSYKYFRISRYGLYGTYKQTLKHDVNGNLISLTHERNSTNKGIRDGKQKHKVKRIKYLNDIKTEKTLYVFRSKGRGGVRKCFKTILYDENGKVISKTND